MGEPRPLLSLAGWPHAMRSYVLHTPWGRPHPAEVWQEWGLLLGTVRTGPLLTLVDLGLACVSKGRVTLSPLLFLLCDNRSQWPLSLGDTPFPLLPCIQAHGFCSCLGHLGEGTERYTLGADEQAGGHSEEEPCAEQNPVLSSPAHVGTEGSFAHQGWAFCASPGPDGLERDLEDGES